MLRSLYTSMWVNLSSGHRRTLSSVTQSKNNVFGDNQNPKVNNTFRSAEENENEENRPSR